MNSGGNGMVLYIYEIEGEKYYLSTIENHKGLIAFSLNEMLVADSNTDNLVDFKNVVTRKIEKMHPVLLYFLNKDWQLYNDIIEGVPDIWNDFISELNSFERKTLE